MTVGNSLVKAYLLNFIRTAILERSLMNAVIVEKLSDRSHLSFFIRKFTVEGKAMNVINVEKVSFEERALFYMGRVMMKKKSVRNTSMKCYKVQNCNTGMISLNHLL